MSFVEVGDGGGGGCNGGWLGVGERVAEGLVSIKPLRLRQTLQTLHGGHTQARVEMGRRLARRLVGG